VAEVSSIVRDRRRAFGVVAVLAISVALVWAPVSFGAGDPIATGTFNFKLSGGFKHQLKRNGVKLKPKHFKIKSGSSLDPTTGAATIKLGKIIFKKGGKKVVYGSARAKLGRKGNIKGSSGKLFSLKGGKVTRNGFGATVTGVKAKFLKSAAKKINKALGLHSVHPGSAGSLTVSEQPQTVEVLSGEATVAPDARLPAGSGTVASKLVGHCIDPFVGLAILPPATVGAGKFHFPVTGGTISPAGNDGVINTGGGVRLQNGNVGAPLGSFQPTDCPDVAPGTSTSTSYVETTNLSANLLLNNIQSSALIGGTNPGCWSTNNPPGCGVIPGEKGIAITQSLNPSGETVTADPNARQVKVSGVTITNNATSSLVLNGVFPLAGAPSNPSFGGGDQFADGDIFGKADLTVNVR
jgi:hypothetical protein